VRLCFPLLTRRDDVAAEFTARAQWTLDVLVHWYRGEARTVDLRAEIARVDLPTYVLAAENDPITTFAAAEEVVAALPAASVRFRRVPGAAHGVFLDAPEEFDAVRAFILEADVG
jgi:pimeloyl-ACP methyl ester carboxylesterase